MPHATLIAVSAVRSLLRRIVSKTSCQRSSENTSRHCIVARASAPRRGRARSRADRRGELGVRSHRRTADAARRADDLAVAQPDRALGARGDLRIVGDDEDRDAGLVDLGEQIHDLLARLAVERAGRLVGEDQPRLADQRARDRDALLLTARHLRRQVVGPVAQADALEVLRRRSGCASAARRPGSRAAARRSRARS